MRRLLRQRNWTVRKAKAFEELIHEWPASLKTCELRINGAYEDESQ
jgi:hypothetical protein